MEREQGTRVSKITSGIAGAVPDGKDQIYIIVRTGIYVWIYCTVSEILWGENLYITVCSGDTHRLISGGKRLSNKWINS